MVNGNFKQTNLTKYTTKEILYTLLKHLNIQSYKALECGLLYMMIQCKGDIGSLIKPLQR